MSSSLPFGDGHTPNSNSLDYKRVRQSDPHKPNPINRTKTIGVKVSEAAYEALRRVAEGQGKPLSEWCRDRIMEATAPPGPRPADFAVIAEVTATQAILIDLLCAMGRDGRFSTQKAQEIVDKAHDQKYKEANELLSLGYAKAPKYRIVIPPLGEGRSG